MRVFKKVFATVSALALVACTQSSNKTSSAPGAADKQTAIEKSFMVKGDLSVIKNQMSQMGLNAHYQAVYSGLDIYHVEYTGKKSYEQVASQLASEVESIEQDYTVQLEAIEKKYEWPEDKYFFYQWAFNNMGQSAPWGLPGEYDADIKLLQAIKKYADQVTEDTVVAVIDTGVNYKHEDLNANMWVNEKEAQKSNGVAGQDDDGNGYCDDVHGYDFVSSGRMKPHCGKIGDPDPIDDHGHGSHCAGSIAAISNNQKGISGINPRAKIMALRALGAGGGRQSDIARAVGYAIENGANVISASFGGGGKSPIMEAMIKEAGEKGILFVAAVGNDGKSLEPSGQEHYPSSYELPTILRVGASDNMDNPATFSNYGANHVDVFAPGVGIISLGKTEGYTIMSGTSMAAPIVAGMASLLMSVYPELKSNPARVKEIIMATVDKKVSMYGKVKSNGRVNVLAALDQAKSAVQQSPLVWKSLAQKVEQIGYNTELVDIRHTIEQPGAKAMRAHFDFIELDRSFDSVYIYDKNFNLVHELQQGSSRDHWSPVVNGDKMIIRFVNAKVRRYNSSGPIKMAGDEVDKCLRGGGTVTSPEAPADPTDKIEGIACLTDNMEYRYEDLQKDIDDNDVFFSWQSEGFSVDKIEYTETAI